MENPLRTYIAIDLKSFYASVECVDRGLNPLTTNLVVADVSRTEKTICLAVSPSLKEYGIGGRARLFEVVQRMREVNFERQSKVPGHRLTRLIVIRSSYLYLQTQECDIVAGFGIAHMGGHFPENIANQLTGIIHGMFFQNIYQPVITRLLLVHILCLSHTVGI